MDPRLIRRPDWKEMRRFRALEFKRDTLQTLHLRANRSRQHEEAKTETDEEEFPDELEVTELSILDDAVTMPPDAFRKRLEEFLRKRGFPLNSGTG